MPKIKTIEEKDAIRLAEEQKCEDLVKQLNGTKIDPKRRYDLKYLQRLVNVNKSPEAAPKAAKQVKVKPVAKANTKFDLEAFKKEMLGELKDLLNQNKISTNGNGHVNGTVKENIEVPAAAAPEKNVSDFGKSSFYDLLENTKTHRPAFQEPQPPPPPPPIPEPKKEQDPPGDKKDGTIKDETVHNAEVIDDAKTEPIDWDDKDVEALIDLWPEVQAAITNGVFMAINGFDPSFDRKISVEDIGSMSEFRRKMLRPGLKVILSKVGAPSDNPEYILIVLAAFLTLDAFMYSTAA